VASGREKAEQINWQTRLLIHLERQKRYPLVARQRNEQGIVRVRVTIDRQGRVLSTSLSQSSGSQWLDREALALPARAQPLPAPPDSMPGDPLALQIPISFTLR
jgi:protein TonB